MKNIPFKKPRLKAYFNIILIDDTTCEMRGGEDESEIVLLRGQSVKDVYQLLPYLNGKCTTENIADKLGDKFLNILELLYENNLLEEGLIPAGITHDEVDFYQEMLLYFSHGGNSFDSLLKLKNANVSYLATQDGALYKKIVEFLSLSGVGTNKLYTLFKPDNSLMSEIRSRNPYIELEWRCIENLEDIFPVIKMSLPDLLIVPIESFSPSILHKVNSLSIETGLHWMITKQFSGYNGHIGPILIPGETACYNCLELRTKSNLSFYSEYKSFEKWVVNREKRRAEKYGTIPPFTGIIAGYTALEVLKYLTNIQVPNVLGSFLSVNFFTLEVEPHKVLKVPYCSECDRKEIPSESPWKEPVPKK